jgi:hypothetical protein
VTNSDEEDAIKEEHGDTLEGMYTPGMNPEKGPVKLTQAQVAAQKAAAQALPRSQTPVGGSSDDDDPGGSEHIWSQTRGCMRKNKNYRKAATNDSKANAPVPAFVPEPTRLLTPVNSDTEDQEYMTEDQKRCARTGNKKSKKASIQPMSPKPMETRRQAASRAGGLQSVGGSGQTDTCVAQGNPSKT